MKNKKVLYILGACALALVTSSAAIFNCLNDHVIKQAKADEQTFIGNIEFYSFTNRLDDIEFNEPDVYWYEGEFQTYNLHFTSISITIYEESEDIFKLSRIRLDTGNLAYDVYDRGFTNDWTHFHLNEAWKGIDVRVALGGDEGFNVLNTLWTILPLNETGETKIFQFDNQINYYAPFGDNVSSDYASFTIPNNLLHYMYTLYQGWFESGGQLFNEIQLEYWSADGTSYNSEGDVWQGGGVYYGCMYYVNTLTNSMVTVNQRDRNTYTKGSAYGYYLLKSSTWRSQSYRSIKLYGEVDDILATKLDTLNNASNYASGFSSSTEAGLGDALNLIGYAFKSTTPILQIQVLPGISLGLLLFLPLIAGIVIFIIWIVKR